MGKMRYAGNRNFRLSGFIWNGQRPDWKRKHLRPKLSEQDFRRIQMGALEHRAQNRDPLFRTML